MIPKLALLSGKGGSGKTTIALSLTKMLSDCGIRTLLIDCDIATNGATYFFETKFEKKEQYLSLSDLFSDDYPFKNILYVDDAFGFVPSNTIFPSDNDALSYKNNDIFVENLNNLESDFDVIIFDCQAGYSNILNTILDISTKNLIVLEPDAISSSSIRVLYAQVSALIEKVKTFQIFNKITNEEYSVYKQIVSGTTFPSLPPIKFNWEVRKAFVFAQVPEMVSTNVEFGKDVFELAKILFPEFDELLFNYTRTILTQEKEELELELEMKKSETSKYYNIKKTSIFAYEDSLFLVFISVMIGPFWFTTEYSSSGLRIFIFLISLLVGLIILLSYRCFRNKAEMKKVQATYDYEYSKLSKRISEIDRTVMQRDNVDNIGSMVVLSHHNKKV